MDVSPPFDIDGSTTGIPGLVSIESRAVQKGHVDLGMSLADDFIALLLLVRGRIVCHSGSQTYRLTSRDHFVIFRDDGAVTGEAGSANDLCRIVLNLRRSRAGFLGLDSRGSGVLQQALGALSSRHFRAKAGAEEQLRTAGSLLNADQSPLGRVRAAQALVRFVLDAISAAEGSARDQITPAMRDLTAWLRQLPDDQWVGVPEMADRTGLSLPWFQARFRQELGLPPAEYWLRMKLERACKRLRGGTHSVGRIAASLGFASAQNFATAFRRHYKQTPTDYRRDPRRKALASRRRKG